MKESLSLSLSVNILPVQFWTCWLPGTKSSQWSTPGNSPPAPWGQRLAPPLLPTTPAHTASSTASPNSGRSASTTTSTPESGQDRLPSTPPTGRALRVSYVRVMWPAEGSRGPGTSRGTGGSSFKTREPTWRSPHVSSIACEYWVVDNVFWCCCFTANIHNSMSISLFQAKLPFFMSIFQFH